MYELKRRTFDSHFDVERCRMTQICMSHRNDIIFMLFLPLQIERDKPHTFGCRLTNIRNALVQVQLRVVFVIDSSRQMGISLGDFIEFHYIFQR